MKKFNNAAISQTLPGQKLTRAEVAYLYNLTKDEDLTPEKFATSKDMSIDLLMTNLVSTRKYEKQRFIADSIAPVKTVRSRKGSYKKRGQEGLSVSVSDTGSDTGETMEIGRKVGEGSYTTEPRRLKTFVSDEEMEENGVFDAAKEGTMDLDHGIRLRQEIRIRNLADATSNSAAAGAAWATGATVHADVASAKNAFELQHGLPATDIVIPSHTVNSMLANASLDMGVFSATAVPRGSDAVNTIDAGQFPNRPWGLVPRLPNSMYNASADPEVITPTRVWSGSAFLIHVDPASRSSTWAVQQQLMGATIIRWRDEDKGGWYYKILQKRDESEVLSDAIYEITGI